MKISPIMKVMKMKTNFNIDREEIIEKPKQSLSFVEQLQNQIQLCREAMSDPEIPLTPKVEALETLLWAKLLKDEEYKTRMKELNEQLQKRKELIKTQNPSSPDWQQEEALTPYIRQRAKQQFKAIMIFIDTKGYMPIGDENE